MFYLALVTDAPDGGYDFICPDVPGYNAYAPSRDFAEAAAVAREVLAGHLAALIDNGGALPPARDLAALRADPDYTEEFEEAVTTIMLPALVPAGRSVRVNLSLDENTLAIIDAGARDRSLTRSAFVAEACRRFVGGMEVAAPRPRARISALGHGAVFEERFSAPEANFFRETEDVPFFDTGGAVMTIGIGNNVVERMSIAKEKVEAADEHGRVVFRTPLRSAEEAATGPKSRKRTPRGK